MRRLYVLCLVSVAASIILASCLWKRSGKSHESTALENASEFFNQTYLTTTIQVPKLSILKFMGMEPSGLVSCEINLRKADEDDNGELFSSEFATFVAYESHGAINETFVNLQLIFVSIFYAVACDTCYDNTGDSTCCVGTKAFIPLSDRQAVQFVCSTVDDAIADLITPSPTIPSAPTPTPFTSPISPSLSPTRTPLTSPTKAPLVVPSAPAPTVSPVTPVATPTMAPAKPVVVPTATPIVVPTLPPAQPTVAPASLPIPTKTPIPPSIVPTLSERPSNVPSDVPSDFPSIAPTNSLPQVCVRFSYTIENQANLSASDIFNEVNNTIKQGLIIATTNITIQIMNASFPRMEGNSSSMGNTSSMGNSSVGNVSRALGYHLEVEHDRVGRVERAIAWARQHFGGHQNKRVPASTLELGLAGSRRYLLSAPDSSLVHQVLATSVSPRSRSRRKLVYYTDEIPPEINQILDNPVCAQPPTGTTNCAIVFSTVCVVLEPGDDEEVVRETLLTGLKECINNGTFAAAFPPENLP